MSRRVHPIGHVLIAAADGRFPAADGASERVAPLPDSREAVLDMTAHAFVATALSERELAPWSPDGLGRALDPAFLVFLAGRDGRIGSHIVVLVRRAIGGGTSMAPSEHHSDHPRVRRVNRRLTKAEVFADERGLIAVGENILGCTEVSLEVDAASRGRGLGRELIRELLRVPPEGDPVFAHVAPGNTASLRAFIATAFVPIASVVFISVGDRA